MGQILWPNLSNSFKDNIRLSQDLSSFKNIIFKMDFAGMQSSLYLLLCSIFFLSVQYFWHFVALVLFARSN